MAPLTVNLNVLRAMLATEAGELRLEIGRVLMARVAALSEDGSGMLAMAGTLLTAKLPAGLSVGQELKLAVRELQPDKVVLGIDDGQAQSEPQVAPPLLAPMIPMPLGGSLRIKERGGSRSAPLPDGSHTLSLRYDAPSFGAIDMHFALSAGGTLKLSLTVPPGEGLRRAKHAAAALTDALKEVTDGPVSLSVQSRHEPLEVFA